MTGFTEIFRAPGTGISAKGEALWIAMRIDVEDKVRMRNINAKKLGAAESLKTEKGSDHEPILKHFSQLTGHYPAIL